MAHRVTRQSIKRELIAELGYQRIFVTKEGSIRSGFGLECPWGGQIQL